MMNLVLQHIAAKELKIKNRQVINNWIRRGHIKVYEIGGARFVDLDECREHVRQSAESANPIPQE